MGASILQLATSASAQWLPQSTSVWEPTVAEPHISLVNVAVDQTGQVSVGLAYRDTSEPGKRATVVQFDAAGNLAWVQANPPADRIGPVALITGNRVVSVGHTSASSTFAPFVTVRDRASGTTTWHAEPSAVEVLVNPQFVTRVLDQAPNSAVLVRAHDDDEFIVLRYDDNGNALPSWRWTCDVVGSAATYGIRALSDGGAIVTGTCSFDSGYRTIRFDALGGIVFQQTEPAEVDNIMESAAFLAEGSSGSTFVAIAPESFMGVPRAQVRKIAADGTTLWTRPIPQPSQFDGFNLRAFTLAGNGDLLLALDAALARSRVARIDGTTGDLLWASLAGASGDAITGLAEAANGRILLAANAYVPAVGHRIHEISEYTADGSACRRIAALDIDNNVRVAAGPSGWIVAGTGSFPVDAGNFALIVHHFDSTGSCELLFANGFEGTGIP